MQTLSWQTGDRYRCEDGTVMEIHIAGHFQCDKPCTHGNLMSRISGRVDK